MVDRVLIKNYFTRRLPKSAVIIAIIGLLFTAAAPSFGLLLLLIGGGWIAYIYVIKKAATEEQVDEMLRQDLLKLQEKGLDKFGLLKEEVSLIQPIIVRGPHYEYLNEEAKLMFKRGKDNEIRYTNVKGVVFYFSEDQVYAYSCVFDLCTGVQYTETTDEYFYKDIVSIATKSEKVKYEGITAHKLFNTLFHKAKAEDVHDVETFTLTTSGGTSISAYIRDKTLMREAKGNMTVTDVEEKIKAMRNLLREKKVV